MKILFYLPNLWVISAVTRLAIDLATVLREKYNVQIDFAVNKRIHEDIEDLPFNLYVLNRKGDLGKALGIKEVIEKNNYDIVLSYMLTQNIALSIAKYLLNKKNKTVFIGSVHNSDNYMKVNSAIKYPYRILMKKLYENLDGIITVSDAVKEDIMKAYFVREDKIKTIYNYIDVEKLRNLAKEPLNEKEKAIFIDPVIVNVGRMETQKGQEYLIKAFSLVKKEIPNAKLLILGDGSLRGRLEKLAKDLNCEENIYMLGYVKNPFKYLVNSQIFVLSSLWEGTPMVVLEAQALGLPIISFNSQGGHVDVVKNSGILVENKNYKNLAKNIVKLLKDETLRKKYSELSLKNISSYTVENKAKEYFEYFLKKLEEKGLKT